MYMFGIYLKDIRHFLVRSSPVTHAANLHCPLFLFHSREDQVAPISNSQRLVEILRERESPVPVEFKSIGRGDHYQPMIDEGIPAGIAWMKSLER